MSEDNGRLYWYRGDEVGQLVALTPWFNYVEDERDPTSLPPVYLRLGLDDRGRHVCSGVIIGDFQVGQYPREINAASLRAIHLPQIIEWALKTGEIPDEYGESVKRLLDSVPSIASRPGRSGYDDDHYANIARMYRRGLVESPGSPTKWLSETLNQSPPTVRRWLREARERGHLGKADPGRSGEKR